MPATLEASNQWRDESLSENFIIGEYISMLVEIVNVVLTSNVDSKGEIEVIECNFTALQMQFVFQSTEMSYREFASIIWSK